MAAEELYAAVSPQDTGNFIAEAPDAGDPVTYAEVNVKLRSDRPDRTPKITHSVTCSQNPPWCFLVVALLFSAVILLVTVILLALKCDRH